MSQNTEIDLLVLILLAKSSDPWGVGRVRQGSENAFRGRSFMAKLWLNDQKATFLPQLTIFLRPQTLFCDPLRPLATPQGSQFYRTFFSFLLIKYFLITDNFSSAPPILDRSLSTSPVISTC